MLSRIGKLESAQDRAALVEVLVANPTFEARTIYRLISQLAKGVPLSVAVEEALGQAPPAYVDTRSDEEKREEALAKFLIGVSDLIEGLDLLKALAPQGDLTQLPGPYQAQVVEAMGWVMTALEANQFTAHS
jgi:hypothetical protein